MRLALWTPRAGGGWPARIAPLLARSAALELISSEPATRPPAELDLYDVANDPAHGFVYRALRERPGLVVLDEWNLHALVLGSTAGRGDPEAYRREARRERGACGSFIARQVLEGTAGALPGLLPLNDRVLDASVALVATREDVRERAARRLAPRPAVLLPLADSGEASDETVAALLALAEGGIRRLPELERLRGDERALEATPLGRALDELRPRARELGLRGLPDSARVRLAGLLPGLAPRGRG